MSAKVDSNMRAKILKVRKYDVAARRERTCDSIIQDSHQRARNSAPAAKFEIVYVSGQVERFYTHESFDKIRSQMEQYIVYVRDLRPRPYGVKPHEQPLYVITLKGGKYVRYYNADNALDRLHRDECAVSLRFFPSLEVVSK